MAGGELEEKMGEGSIDTIDTKEKEKSLRQCPLLGKHCEGPFINGVYLKYCRHNYSECRVYSDKNNGKNDVEKMRRLLLRGII